VGQSTSTFQQDDACDLIGRFTEILDEMNKADVRYRDLLQEREQIRSRIMKLFGVLGVHFPEVSPELGELICPDKTTSSEYRQRHLSLDVTFELFLRGLQGKATAGNFNSFVSYHGIHEFPTTEEAIDSVVKSRPELFGEQHEGGKKFYVLGEV
jgi:hypothetical protein